MIVIKNVKLQPLELEILAHKMGDQVVKMPPAMFEGQIDKDAQSVTYLGNINSDGEPGEKKANGEYWHQDGSKYCSPTSNRIITILNCFVAPVSGGTTAFVDLQKGWESLSNMKLDEVGDLMRSELHVEQILLNEVNILSGNNKKEEPIVHEIVQTNPFNNKKTLFIGGELSLFKIQKYSLTKMSSISDMLQLNVNSV